MPVSPSPKKAGVSLNVAWDVVREGGWTKEDGDDGLGVRSDLDLSGVGLVKVGTKASVDTKQKEKSGKRGNNAYCWIAWEKEEWDEGEGVVVKSFEEVIKGAEK